MTIKTTNDLRNYFVEKEQKENNVEFIELNQGFLDEAGELVKYMGVSTLKFNDIRIEPIDENDQFNVIGKISAFNVDHDANLTAQVLSNQQILLSLTIKPVKTDWNFKDSFPKLPDYLGADGAFLAKKPSFFYALSFEAPCFIVSTHHDKNNQIEKGLNFQSQLLLAPPFDLVQSMVKDGGKTPLAVYGTIDLSQDFPLIQLYAPVAGLQFPLGKDSIKSIHLELETEKSVETQQPESIAFLTGDISIGDEVPPIRIEASILQGNFSWKFAAYFEKDSLSLKKGFDGLAALAGLQSSDFKLPSAFDKFTSFYLAEVGIGIIPNKRIQYVSFVITSSDIWTTPFPNFDITNITVGWTFLLPVGNSPLTTHGYVFGDLHFGEKPDDFVLEVEARLPEFVISASLIEGTQISLTAIMKQYFGEGYKFEHDLMVDRFDLVADINNKTYNLIAEIKDDWPIISNLILSPVTFSIGYKTGGFFGSISAQFNLTLNDKDVPQIQFYIKAAHPLPGAGWQFEGGSITDKKIPIGKLIESLDKAAFGEIILPKSIEGAEIEKLYISFNTQSKDFTFSMETTFPLDGQPLDMTLTIEIKRQIDTTYSKHFSGQIKIDGMQFNVIFDSKLGANTFIAAYSDPTGKEGIDLQKLFPSLPVSISITLKDALLAYQSLPNVTPSSKYLFALDVDGGLNLSSLHLDDLPLVSSTEFPADETLKLSFQVLATSPIAAVSQPATFSQAEITALNALLPPGPNHLPVQDVGSSDKPVILNTTLRLGGQTTQLPLNVGVGTGNNPLTGGGTNTTPGTQNGPNAPLPQADGTQWVTIQKTFGPLNIAQVGVNYKDGKVTALLNAALTVGGLTIALQGLNVSSPLQPLSPTFGLNGLGIEYKNDAIEISGAFLKLTDPKIHVTQFAGLAVLRAGAFSLSAIGAYSKTKAGEPSLFLYATLGYPLGGPPFFFVTGLAAGFGYNRAIVAPTIDQVVNFPLVTQAMGGPATLPADAAGQQALLTQKLQSLSHYVPITSGQMFFAVGIRFTSFKMVDAFALLMIQFGQRTEIDLLGLATLVVPTPPEDGEATLPALAEAQLALKATYIPADGFLSVEAQLTPASFLFDRACHITGGFAFYSWLSGDYAGDFVLTLGGYHPHFKVPVHYPQRVPRLGINWQILPPIDNPTGITTRLTIVGQAYYALAAHALMAGGGLAADYRSDWVHAWFKAGADFLVTWQPYHYEASMYIALGAEVTLGLIHISFDAGADLTLWGPPFGGHANVHLRIIGIKVSFDVDFGGGPVGAKPIPWDAFKKAFLPADDQICSISVQHGLLRQITEGTTERWIVNPQSFALVTNTVIPAKNASAGSLSTNGTDDKKIPIKNDKGETVSLGEIAVQPVNVLTADLTSTHSITITRTGTPGTVEGNFTYATMLKKVPMGLWGTPVMDGEFLAKPDENDTRFVENALCGLIISPKPPKQATHTHSVDREKLAFETTSCEAVSVWDGLNSQTIEFYATPQEDKAAWEKVNIMDKTVAQKRTDLLAALGFSTATLDFGQPVDQFALSAPQTFTLMSSLTTKNTKS